jgi:DNA-binding cell septation regulator SpoVG
MPEMEVVHNAFKDYFNALNLELETKIKNQIIEKYGKISAYCFKDNETLSSIESEIDAME